MFGFLKTKLKKISKSFSKVGFSLGSKLKAILTGKRDETSFEHLEELFFEADLGAELSLELVEKVRKIVRKNPAISTEEILSEVHKELAKVLEINIQSQVIKTSPYVIMVVGVNGSGKTTTIAKLAQKYKKDGKKVLLVAADTFRAAAIDQLSFWAKKIGVDCIKSLPNSDPASVVHDGLTSAKAKGYDIVIIDTAGRLHTKTDLMHELEKIKRISMKIIEHAPHHILLVLDATTGQNAIDQAKIFHKYTPISSIALTKLDGSAKGGIVIAIQRQLKIPVQWVGLGEGEEDLVPFNANEFLNSLLAHDES
jgi:fused signal recognition particle receptor